MATRAVDLLSQVEGVPSLPSRQLSELGTPNFALDIVKQGHGGSWKIFSTGYSPVYMAIVLLPHPNLPSTSCKLLCSLLIKPNPAQADGYFRPARAEVIHSEKQKSKMP